MNSNIIPPGAGEDSVTVSYIICGNLWHARSVPKDFIITLPSPMDSTDVILPEDFDATFLGWNTIADTIAGYRVAGDTVMVSDDTDFYAIFVSPFKSANP